jgi:hypothetical protein
MENTFLVFVLIVALFGIVFWLFVRPVRGKASRRSGRRDTSSSTDNYSLLPPATGYSGDAGGSGSYFSQPQSNEYTSSGGGYPSGGDFGDSSRGYSGGDYSGSDYSGSDYSGSDSGGDHGGSSGSDFGSDFGGGNGFSGGGAGGDFGGGSSGGDFGGGSSGDSGGGSSGESSS